MFVGGPKLANGKSKSADAVANSNAEHLEIEFSDIPDDIETIFLKNIALQLSMKIAEDNHEMQNLLG